jgi:hypothetical protein
VADHAAGESEAIVTRACHISAILLLAGIAAADAAPNIPPSELPGRERYRFQESPFDRFMQPDPLQQGKPVWRWECKHAKTKRSKHRRSVSKRC